jgi:hypothetical protein
MRAFFVESPTGKVFTSEAPILLVIPAAMVAGYFNALVYPMFFHNQKTPQLRRMGSIPRAFRMGVFFMVQHP